jgi:hypothetical protein
MKKLQLTVDTLRVDTFVLAAGHQELRGTVAAAQAAATRNDPTCGPVYSCANYCPTGPADQPTCTPPLCTL